MSHIADRFVAVLDANVLYPFLQRDILLRFAEAGLYRARWSSDIINEWTSYLLANKPHLEDSVKEQVAAMGEAFEEAWVENYADLIPTLTLPDENDRHVLAAAIKCSAGLIVTENLKDFPGDVLDQYDIEALSTDNFLVSTFELYPSQSLEAIRKMRKEYVRPIYTPDKFITHLRRNGLGQLAAKIRPDIDTI